MDIFKSFYKLKLCFVAEKTTKNNKNIDCKVEKRQWEDSCVILAEVFVLPSSTKWENKPELASAEVAPNYRQHLNASGNFQ